MLLVLSQNKGGAEYLINAIKNIPLPIFAYFRAFDNIEDLPIAVRAVVINECGNAEISSKLCEDIRKDFPNASLGVILNEAHAQNSLFRHVKNADFELISPFSEEKFAKFLKDLGIDNNIDRFSPTLTCSAKAAALMGYDLDLSQSEYRLLTFLIAFDNHICPSELIQEVCFVGTSSVRVLIDRINKKAKNISGRPLILSHYGKGYSINQNP